MDYKILDLVEKLYIELLKCKERTKIRNPNNRLKSN